jgi:hypothetical protein
LHKICPNSHTCSNLERKIRRPLIRGCRERWFEKDELMEKWYQGGQKRLGTGSEGEQEVVIPLELRTIGEAMDAFCWFAPALAGVRLFKAFLEAMQRPRLGKYVVERTRDAVLILKRKFRIVRMCYLL